MKLGMKVEKKMEKLGDGGGEYLKRGMDGEKG